MTTTERGGPDRGYDGTKKIRGRKRHLLVDTLGLLIAVVVIGANLDDGATAPLLLAQVSAEEQLRLSVMFGDNKYRNHLLNAWMAEHRRTWTSEVQSPLPGTKGFGVVRIRWVVERTNALERSLAPQQQRRRTDHRVLRGKHPVEGRPPHAEPPGPGPAIRPLQVSQPPAGSRRQCGVKGFFGFSGRL